MTLKSKWVLGLSMGVSALLLGGWFAFSRGKDTVVFTVDTVKRQDLREGINANGEIQAKTRVQVGVQVTAPIREIHIKDGQWVKAGDLLVTLDQEHYRQALNQATMGLRMARKDMECAETTFRKLETSYDRQQALLDKGVISDEDFQQAKLQRDTAATGFERAKVAVQQAQAQVALAADDLSKTEIRASMSGRVTGLKAEKGEMAIPGTPNLSGATLMVISDLSEMVAEVKVGELDVVKLKVGLPAEVQVDALPGQVFQGQVMEVATSVDTSTQPNMGSSVQDAQNYRVRIQLRGSADQLGALHPGMSARVAVLAHEVKNALTVPLQAIQERDVKGGGLNLLIGTRAVAFVVRAGKVEERALTVGIGTRRAVQVLAGVKEGEQVIIGPPKSMAALTTGTAVKSQSEQEALKGRKA